MKQLVLALLALALVVSPTFGDAQGVGARRRVNAGEVTGLEMGIDGALRVVPGGRLRWFLALYEVLRRTDLRPAPNARLTVTASFAPTETLATVTTDARGRAAIDLAIPDTLDDGPRLRIVADSPRGVQRVFSVDLELTSRHVIELYADRGPIEPGARFSVVGRVIDAGTDRPVPNATVTLRARQSTGDGPPIERTTDEHGVFAAERLSPPSDTATDLVVTAETEHGSATRSIPIAAPDGLPLRVEARPSVPIAAPGEEVPIDVTVRTRAGLPLAGARLTFADAPRDEHAPPAPMTDANGRGRIVWTMPRTLTAPSSTETRHLVVVHPRHGSVDRVVGVLVARVPASIAWAVEGGSAIPGLPHQLFVRAARPDGSSIAGEAIHLSSAQLDEPRTATTDADGVAVFEVRLSPDREDEACGGVTAVAVEIRIGTHAERACLPLDPDASVRVESPTLDGVTLRVPLERATNTRGAPIEVTASVSEDGRFVPVARAVAEPRDAAVTLSLPEGTHGELLLRARAIVAGGAAARGGSRLVYVPGARGPLRVEASQDGARVASDDPGTLAVFASTDAALLDAIRHRLGPVAAAVDAGRTPAFVDALLASRTPHDSGASLAFQAGELVAQPLPEDPLVEGLLRDPWRTRARFVRGRIGLVMRAVEDHVDRAIPDRMDEVSVRDGATYRFNSAILEAAIEEAGLGEESATSLDGEPLDIDVLRTLDPAFTYDHVARRLTRERLFRLLVMIREVVQRLGLDRPWARRGDPSGLVVSVLDVRDQGSVEFSTSPEREHLFDAWGRPFVLRAVRGRARFSFLEPLSGWDLLSTGPDGRAGTRDDVVDPFARVLPSTGLYAEAVGEDELLARLSGVVLGRATLEALAAVFQPPEPIPLDDVAPAALARWDAVPVREEPIDEDAPFAAMQDPAGGLGAAPSSWSLPPPRQRYRATALRFGADGSLASATARFDAGAPWIANVELPDMLRPGDALRIPLVPIPLADDPPPSIDVVVRGRAIAAHAGDGFLSLEAHQPGLADVTVTLRAGTQPPFSLTRRVRVVPEGALRMRAHTVRVEGSAELRAEIADAATPWRNTLTLGAPRALARDPSLDAVRTERPAPFAWAAAMAGDAIEPALLARTLGRTPTTLERACAIVAWATDPTLAGRVPQAIGELPVPDDLPARAALLVALGPSAAPGAGTGDPLTALVDRLRADGWGALGVASDDPAAMARMAAGLLLADRRDASGRALLARVVETLDEDDQGRRWVPGKRERAGDSFIGTLALAIAARQAGDDALADALGDAALSRLPLGERTGIEGLFWTLAASVYGAFGVDGPETAQVVVEGRTQSLALERGIGTLAVPSGARVEVTSDRPVWARVEARYVVPVTPADGSPLRARIDGSTGRLGEAAALELVVANAGDDTVGAPVIELSVPAAAALGADAREAMLRVEGVLAASEPDGAGVIRIQLAALPAGAERRIPLALRWRAAGRSHGLALTAYDASEPWAIHAREGRVIEIAEDR